MSDFLPCDAWEWEDFDGDIEVFSIADDRPASEHTCGNMKGRLDWDCHDVTKLLDENHFHIRYQMSLEDFDAVVQLLGDDVVPNCTMSGHCRCDAVICPEMAVAIGI
jgi:hypothetical protein